MMESVNSEQLLHWLAKELAQICDSEPNEMAKYVYGLLKYDGGDLRQHCIAELSDILKSHTEHFVDSLLDTIENGSYVEHPVYDDDEENHRQTPRDDSDDERDYRGGRRRFDSNYESGDKRRRTESDEGHNEPKSYPQQSRPRHDTSTRIAHFDKRDNRRSQQQYMGYVPPYMMQGMPQEMMWGGYPPMMSGMPMYETQHAPPMPRVQALLGISDQSSPAGSQPPVAWPTVEESHTLRCTGIPPYIKENELLGHFRSFGRIAKLELRALAGDEPEQGRKVYNECVVQFLSAVDMKKCLSSPIPVLNNRFIKLYVAPVNLIPLAEVPHQEEVRDVPGPGRGGRGGRGRGRGSMSWVAPAEEGENGVSERSERPERVVDEQVVMEKQRQQSAITKQYEELRQLRQTAEAVWQKKEDLLQGQMDQYRSMINKLDSKPDTLEKHKMIETIEGKIVALQSELQDVRQQREASQQPQEERHSGYGYNAYGGRGRWNSRGRGRGRGANRTLDNRTSAIVITQPPEGFSDETAKNHFSRFGDVSRVESTNDGVVVEFKSRREAISGLKRGANFDDKMLTMDWYEKTLESPRVE